MNLEKIKNFVIQKHGNQKRKQGTPYYLHPIAVAELLKNNGYDLDYQITGLLHDLLEDTEASYEDIVKISNVDIADAVKLLTKEDGYNMQEYIGRIKENDVAKMVKLADRIHNLSESIYASEEFKRKYIKETKEWFVDLVKNTCFEEHLKIVLNKVEESLDDSK